MSENSLVYSIQRTYILTHVLTPEREIVTCNQRIDIPTIEPLTEMKAVVYPDELSKIIPCIELAGNFLSEFNLEFETNEGVTVLPVKIGPGRDNPLENPYLTPRYVLVLPRGATGVKSCRLIHKATGNEIQHNFTFGIMSPPYNYDSAIQGIFSYVINYQSASISQLEKNVTSLDGRVNALETKTDNLKLVADMQALSIIDIPKGAGKKTVQVQKGKLYFDTDFNYSSSSPAGHRPKITVTDDASTITYTLELYDNVAVTIDLLSGIITAYFSNTGEIVKQIKIFNTVAGYNSIAFEDFDDISDNSLTVFATGRRVE